MTKLEQPNDMSFVSAKLSDEENSKLPQNKLRAYPTQGTQYKFELANITTPEGVDNWLFQILIKL